MNNQKANLLGNQIKKYFSHPAVNSSKLKMVNNPLMLYQYEMGILTDDEESRALRVGSAVDCLLTTPERWKYDFFVLNVSKPSGLRGVFIDNLPPNLSPLSPLGEYEKAYTKSGYKLPLKTVVDRFWNSTESVAYYNEKHKIADNDVTILDLREYEAVVEAVQTIKDNVFTAKYFLQENTLHQLPIYFVEPKSGLECKALLDGVYIDYDNKEIIPFDLKTTSKNVFSFKELFFDYKYYIQAGLYYLAIQHWKDKVFDPLGEFTLKQFKFIVTPSVSNSGYPALIFTVSKEGLEQCLNGIIDYRGIHRDGVYTLLNKFKWHKENNYWALPKDIYENNGEIQLI